MIEPACNAEAAGYAVFLCSFVAFMAGGALVGFLMTALIRRQS